MKILVLGGTIFVGRHIVEEASARGHEVTIFNRGQHNPGLFPHVEKLRGDRAGDLAALEGRRWDAVIDTSGYTPRVVRASAELLADATDHYTFISTISVYDDSSAERLDEQSPVGTLQDDSVEEVTGETYGPLKALSERAVEDAMPGRVLTIRPGLIVGPYDPTDRFTYWPQRIAAGGEVLAPGEPEQPVQFIDVRDLATWTVDMVEKQRTDLFNATGPVESLTMGGLLESCKATLNGAARLTWVSEAFLNEHGVTPFVEMPLWVPEEMEGIHRVDIGKALAAGLELRPIKQTIESTFAWHATRPEEYTRKAGISPTHENELLARWHEIADRSTRTT